MAITYRVARLRQYSLDAVPTLSNERAELMTAFYQTSDGVVSTPVHRVLAFRSSLDFDLLSVMKGQSFAVHI